MKSNADLQKDVYEELKWDSRINEGDIGVQSQIKRALHRHAEEDANHINVAVSDGEVVLAVTYF